MLKDFCKNAVKCAIFSLSVEFSRTSFFMIPTTEMTESKPREEHCKLKSLQGKEVM